MTNVTIPDRLVTLTGQIAAAYVSHNAVSAADVPQLLEHVHAALRGLSEARHLPNVMRPAVPPGRSVRHDRLTCLDCGLTFQSLKRHLSVQHQLSPDEYRAKWDLPADYPIVAPDYSSRRSELAKTFGLGVKRGGKARRTR